MRLMTTALIAMITFASVACSAGEASAGADIYWRTFRKAIMADKKNEVAKLVHFPFEVRGVDDADPVKKVDRAGFLALYDRLLAQEEIVPISNQLVSKTMRQLISNKPKLGAEDRLSRDIFRVHQFEFRRIRERWYFSAAYLEE